MSVVTAGLDAERRAEVMARLRAVIDPELGLDIVSLGLVYGIELDGGDVAVTMTLTTPGCPMQVPIMDAVHRVLSAIPWIGATTVQLVWEPRWTPERIVRR